MKYTVTINEKSKSITVDLDGYKGTAKCCPTDTFNITTGIELALERAKVAKANASKPTPTEKPMSVTELVKALEKALPKGRMVIVGNGNYMTEKQKCWLHSLTDCKGGYNKVDLDNAYERGYADGVDNCDCDCNDCACDYTAEDIDEAYNEGYADGYSDGYDEGVEEGLDEDEILEIVRNALRK